MGKKEKTKAKKGGEWSAHKPNEITNQIEHKVKDRETNFGEKKEPSLHYGFLRTTAQNPNTKFFQGRQQNKHRSTQHIFWYPSISYRSYTVCLCVCCSSTHFLVYNCLLAIDSSSTYLQYQYKAPELEFSVSLHRQAHTQRTAIQQQCIFQSERCQCARYFLFCAVFLRSNIDNKVCSCFSHEFFM